MTTTKNYISQILSKSVPEVAPKVLLVQKDNNIICCFRQELTSIGYEVVLSSDVHTAFTLLEKDKLIELVVFDGFLDQNDGLLLLSNIRKKPRYEWTPLLMTLGHGDKQLVERAIKAGVNGILVSPFMTETIREKISQLNRNCRKSVLIVDDDPLILDNLKNVIELERFKVYTAESGESALKLLAAHHMDAVITDIIMPGGMSGVELLKKVKKINKNVPILLITGGGHTYTNEDLTKAGADGFFRKPFHNIELVKKIRQVIHRSSKK